MIKKERLNIMLKMINSNNVMTAKELSNQLNVSIMTINRDLTELEDNHLIQKVHGGATSIEYNNSKFNSFDENKEIHIKEKYEVAKLAGKQIKDNDIVFIGPGTTNELILDYLTAKNVTVVTSNIAVFDKLRDSTSIQVIVIGGKYNSKSNSITGTLAEKMVSTLQFDKCFIGINGIDHLTLTTVNAEAGQIQKIILNNSTQKFIVTDKFKLEKRTFFEFYNLKSDDYIITNSPLSPKAIKYYNNKIRLLLT